MKNVKPTIEDLGNALLELDKIMHFYSISTTEEGREMMKLLNKKRYLGSEIIDAFLNAERKSYAKS